MIHYMSMAKQDEPYLNYNLKHKQGDYITGTFQVKDLPNANPKSNVIPKGKYLVLGDNREVSKDSRAFGLIDEDQIVGKVSFRFWPFSEFKYNFNPENTKINMNIIQHRLSVLILINDVLLSVPQ